MRILLCFLVALMISTHAFGQSADYSVKMNDSAVKPVKPLKIKVYRVNYFVEGAIIGVGMVGDFFAISRLKSKLPVSDEELLPQNLEVQKKLMTSIDNWSLHQKSSDRSLYKKISDDGEIGIFLLPSLLMIDKNIRKDWLHLLFMYVEGHTITFTFYNYSPLGPTFVDRYRPVVYYTDLPHDVRVNNNSRNSFFSGHVGSCAYSTFFMAKVYCDYHPNTGAVKYLLYLAASVPPLVIGYARIKSLDHFPSDVAVGFGLGAIIGIVVPALHKVPCSKHLSLGMFDSPDGMGLTLRWKFSEQHLLTSGK
ncbi:MAG: phosphatase PAP2 family protein [Bacteroidetes bacterium]|nr:phosphatase PAP2 family protein [Bacteroidota bacterium]